MGGMLTATLRLRRCGLKKNSPDAGSSDETAKEA